MSSASRKNIFNQSATGNATIPDPLVVNSLTANYACITTLDCVTTINGLPYPIDPSEWSLYPAIHFVNVSGYDISGIVSFNSVSAAFSPNVIAIGSESVTGGNIIAFGYRSAYQNSGDSVNAIGYQSALENKGSNVNAFGYSAAYQNFGSNVNALGYLSAFTNSGANVNAIGESAAYQNTGSEVNAIGCNAAYHNSGSNVNAIGYSAAYHNSGSNVNTIGYQAAYQNTKNEVNAIGYQAASNNKGGLVNAIGCNAAAGNTGENVNAFGEGAAQNNSGFYVNAIGSNAAAGNTGENVNAIGQGAASGNSGNFVNVFGNAGFNNIGNNVNAIGQQALYQNKGDFVDAFGDNAALSNRGSNVVAIGRQAAYQNSASNVVAIGYTAGYGNTGNNVNAIGQQALYQNKGNFVDAFGDNAALSNRGSNVVAIGTQAGYQNSGNNIIAIGLSAGYTNRGNFVNAIGSSAAYQNSGASVNAIGINAANGNTASFVNAIGSNAACNNKCGFLNAFGDEAGCNAGGSHVVAIGTQAGLSGTGTGVNAIGFNAAQYNTGFFVNAIGSNAASQNSGSNVVAIGRSAAQGNSAADVIAVGTQAGVSNKGSYLTAIGSQAGYNNIGNNCIFLGSNPAGVAVVQNTLSDRMIVYSKNSNNPFLYGDLSQGQLGIGTSGLTANLTVSGTINVTKIPAAATIYSNILGYNTTTGAIEYQNAGIATNMGTGFIRVAKDGSDTLAATSKYMYSFLTISQALASSVAGDEVFICPGTYTEGPLTISASRSVRGANTQGVIITQAAVTNSMTLITMGSNTRIEDVTLTLTSTSAFNSGALYTGVLINNNDLLTAKLRTMVINVNNNNSGGNAIGVRSTGSSSTDFRSSYLIRSATINVTTTGFAAVSPSPYNKGIAVDGSNRMALRDCVVSVQSTGLSLSSTRLIACETTSGVLALDSCTINASSAAIAATNCSIAEISQTAGIIILGGGTGLKNNNANGLGFDTRNIHPNILAAALKTGNNVWSQTDFNSIYYLVPGASRITDLANLSSATTPFSFKQDCLLHQVVLSANVSMGTKVMYAKLYKNTIDAAGFILETNLSGSITSTVQDITSQKLLSTDSVYLFLSGGGATSATNVRSVAVDFSLY